MRQSPKIEALNATDVQKAYRRWAPFYDQTFGKLVEAGVQQTVARANQFKGRLLEVGVGTGLALPHYAPHLSVTGIDVSADMLAKARQRVGEESLSNIESLLEMDATALTLEDASFDVAAAMYVITVVPDPARVMHEMARVVKPGGTVLVASHFSTQGITGVIERGLAKQAPRLGWRPEFPIDTVLVSDKLRLVSLQPIKPLGFFTLLEFRRQS
ncbi:MAG: methyltransferase domain-containing protein [Rhizobiales bacterium]|nr:methyltransferase domain-containing protein [Hyphomicrobiales bacterium]